VGLHAIQIGHDGDTEFFRDWKGIRSSFLSVRSLRATLLEFNAIFCIAESLPERCWMATLRSQTCLATQNIAADDRNGCRLKGLPSREVVATNVLP